MCDYSLHLVASRPAKVGDTLIATDFSRAITRGFAAIGEPEEEQRCDLFLHQLDPTWPPVGSGPSSGGTGR